MTQPGRRDSPAERLERLGAAIRALRERRRLTQAEVAESAGVTANLVGRMEKGTANPTVTMLVRVIGGLHASFAELAEIYDELNASPRAPGREP